MGVKKKEEEEVVEKKGQTRRWRLEKGGEGGESEMRHRQIPVTVADLHCTGNQFIPIIF